MQRNKTERKQRAQDWKTQKWRPKEIRDPTQPSQGFEGDRGPCACLRGTYQTGYQRCRLMPTKSATGDPRSSRLKPEGLEEPANAPVGSRGNRVWSINWRATTVYRKGWYWWCGWGPTLSARRTNQGRDCPLRASTAKDAEPWGHWKKPTSAARRPKHSAEKVCPLPVSDPHSVPTKCHPKLCLGTAGPQVGSH